MLIQVLVIYVMGWFLCKTHPISTPTILFECCFHPLKMSAQCKCLIRCAFPIVQDEFVSLPAVVPRGPVALLGLVNHLVHDSPIIFHHTSLFSITTMHNKQNSCHAQRVWEGLNGCLIDQLQLDYQHTSQFQHTSTSITDASHLNNSLLFFTGNLPLHTLVDTQCTL